MEQPVVPLPYRIELYANNNQIMDQAGDIQSPARGTGR